MSVDYATYYGDAMIGSLRGKDPKRTSTVTMHVPKNLDGTGRCPGIRSHHFGPGVKVIGGDVRYAYEERPSGKAKQDKTQGQDPAQMYAHLKNLPDTLRRPIPGMTYASLGRPQQQQQQPEASVSGRTATDAGSTAARKIVFWDGTQHHVMDEALAMGQTGKGGEWVPPHLELKDVAPGPFLGVRETPGSMPTRIIGSKHRRMPDGQGYPMETPGEGWHTAAWHANGGTSRNLQSASMGSTISRRSALYQSWHGPMTGKLGLAPYAPTHLLRSFGPGEDVDEGSLKDYARGKLMGHKEYEATVKQFDGLDCWQQTQTDLTASMQLGRPSRMLSPYEHSTTKLDSIRRPHTSHF